jgi:hypothetical protein
VAKAIRIFTGTTLKVARWAGIQTYLLMGKKKRKMRGEMERIESAKKVVY